MLQAHSLSHGCSELLRAVFYIATAVTAPCNMPIRPHENGACLSHLPQSLPKARCIVDKYRACPADCAAQTLLTGCSWNDLAHPQRQRLQRLCCCQPRLGIWRLAQEQQQQRAAAAAPIHQVQGGYRIT